MINLEGKVALVTGASRGIGAESAKLLAKAHCKVVINYFSSDNAATNVAQEISDNGAECIIIKADVKDEDQVKKMVKNAISKWNKVDILVNNANISFPIKPFVELKWEDIEAKLIGEIKALYNCTQAVLPSMISQKYGKLIYISSSLSRYVGEGFFAHAGAKSAVDAMVKTLALELGPLGIMANLIGPGLTDTDATTHQPQKIKEMVVKFTPLRRTGKPIDIANVVLFLASYLSDYVNGEYIPVNGGSFMI